MLQLDARIPDLLESDLRNADPDVRETALDRLGVCGGDQTEAIARGLKDPVEAVRSSAAANLGGLRQRHAWPPLVAATRTERSDDVVQQLALAFEGYDDELILQALLELLAQTERDYRIRLHIVAQLWKYDASVTVPRLQEVVVSDDNPLVRLHAADSLELLDDVVPSNAFTRSLWRRLSEDEHVGISSVAAVVLDRPQHAAADLVSVLGSRLNSKDNNERSHTLHRLSMLSTVAPEVAIGLAEPLLYDQHWGVRMSCCHCLGAIRHESAVSRLLATLCSDSEPRVQAAALVALNNYHTSDLGEALLDLLESNLVADEIRSVVCSQLWKYPSDRTIALVRRVLGSSGSVPHRAQVESALDLLERLIAQSANGGDRAARA